MRKLAPHALTWALAAWVSHTVFTSADCGAPSSADPPVSNPSDTPRPAAFVNVTVVPMGRGEALSAQTVVIRNGRIAAIGPSDGIDVPGDVERISGAGKYLMPGLVDAHFHLQDDDADDRRLLAFSRSGVRMMAGTDAPIPEVLPGFSLHDELRLLVAAGLTPYQALRTATANPAEFLGRPGEFGTVAAGARADLLLLDANPLLDVANAARRAGVMVRGRWLTEKQLQALLTE